MGEKTAYFRGPLSNYSTQLAVQLLKQGWSLHIPAKSALNFSLSPLDLGSSISSTLERALGKRGRARELLDRVRLLEPGEVPRGTKYDFVIFCGLPPNFDDPRVSRAPWAAQELPEVCRRLKDVPVILISSLWSAVQDDGVVPEEIEFFRRKPLNHFEGVCQQYELRLLQALESHESLWYLLRLPLITANYSDGSSTNFTGLSALFSKIVEHRSADNVLRLNYNPDATFWMLPADLAAGLTVAAIEDNARPRICNLVSTRATLNQEWLQHLAQAADYERLEWIDRDPFGLSNTLQGMLRDNVQVKTRNLFELMGRHEQSAATFDREYFQRVLQFGTAAHWGSKRSEHYKMLFSPQLAKTYFEEFLPAKLDERLLKRLSACNGGIFFHIEENSDCSWVLKSVDGRLTVSSPDPASDPPAARFIFTPGGFVRLLKHEMLFEQALLTRDLQAQGKGFQLLKACDLLRGLLRDYPFQFNNRQSNNSQQSRLQLLQRAGKE